MGTQVTDEIEMLKRESELPIEDFLDLLPESYLEAAVRQDPLPEITAVSSFHLFIYSYIQINLCFGIFKFYTN